MTNVGTLDRAMRALMALGLLAAALFAPVALPLRVVLGGGGLYMLISAVAATCVGYRLLGMSTCPRAHR